RAASGARTVRARPRCPTGGGWAVRAGRGSVLVAVSRWLPFLAGRRFSPAQPPNRIETIFLSKPIADRSATSPVTTADVPVQSRPAQILIGPPDSCSEDARLGWLTFWQPGPATPADPSGSVKFLPLSRMTLPLPSLTAPLAGAPLFSDAGAELLLPGAGGELLLPGAGPAPAGGRAFAPLGGTASQGPPPPSPV